jgi:hypothetical protein
MSAIVDLLLSTGVDPISILVDLGILHYVRRIDGDLSEEIARNRERTERLESNHMEG